MLIMEFWCRLGTIGWQATNANVISSELVPKRVHSKIAYHLAARYTYAVNSRDYVGTKIRLVGANGLDQEFDSEWHDKLQRAK
jgi:hypothetical protein